MDSLHAFATAAIPSYANNWQWQLDQISAGQQSRISNYQAEQHARLPKEKTVTDKQAETTRDVKSVKTPQSVT